MSATLSQRRLPLLIGGMLASASTVALLGASTLAGASGQPQQPAQRQPQSLPGAPGAAGLETSALINQQLDAPIGLAVVNRHLPDVLREIEEKSLVPIVVTDETYALLPYGRETPINVTGNATLRQTLDLIGSRLGLEYVLRKENVEFRPLPALARTGRRASVQELAGLDLLRTVPLKLAESRPTVAQVLEAVDLKLAEQDAGARQRGEAESGFQIENRLDEALGGRAIFVRRHATLLDALEAVDEQTTATWFPWGDSFIVLPKQDWVRRRLETPTNLSINQVDVQQALLELQQAARVPFAIEPGAIQRVPEEFRRVRLYLENKSIRDALESLGGVTGLGYTVSDAGVYLYHADGGGGGAGASGGANRPGGAVTAGAQEQAILLVDLGDGTSLPLYPSDLSDDLRARLEERRRQAVEQLRQKLPLPATEPAN